MPKKFFLAVALFVSAVCARAQLAIQVDYTTYGGGFFVGHSDRIATLQSAVNYVNSIISSTTLAAITPSSYPTSNWTPFILNPSTGSSTNLTSNMSVATNTILVYAGGRSISGGALGEGQTGGYNSSAGTNAFYDSVDFRGNGTHVMPWGGSLSFNSSATWYFDSNTSTVDVPSGSNDFFSVAVHELFHVLGFGDTSTPFSGTNWSSFVSGSSFTGANAKTANGGSAISLDGAHQHWAEGTFSTVTGASAPYLSQEAAMDPSLTLGSRKYATALDIAALRDLGYSTATPASPIPEPSTYAAIAALAALVVGANRRRRTTAER